MGESTEHTPHRDLNKIIKELQERVIKWEKEHWVTYPWRIHRTPYRVLIAEFLLKRTTRRAVAREFPKFIQRFPDIESIYGASIRELEELLKPLGLYRQRAKQLKFMIESIVKLHKGKIPETWEDLISLPGVGKYLAGAVLSFGYGKRAPVLDSNVIRLLTRLTGLKFSKDDQYLKLLWLLVPEKDHTYFNYGMIDLGALICHYRKPKCEICPLRELCVYYMKKSGRNDLASRLESAYRNMVDHNKQHQ